MSAIVAKAMGPQGFGVYKFDSVSGELTPVTAQAFHLIVPGFVDVHIHGAFGIDFMTTDATSIITLCDKLKGAGYEAWLPTTVSASVSDVKAALAQIPVHPMIPGFHLEGPFISPQYPGAQPPSAILDPADAGLEWEEVFDDPRLKLITLAPERPGARELIQRLQRRGVIVSMGHTDATYDQTLAGVDWGVRHATHMFNAMRPFHHREAGAVGAILLQLKIIAELIYDRLHVSRASAEVLIRNKSERGVIAVSDSTMASGMEPGQEIEMWGLKCTVGDKEVRLASNGALAGSGITLLDAFRNLHDDFGPKTAIQLCTLNPRKLLGMSDAPKVWNVFDSKLNLVDQVSR